MLIGTIVLIALARFVIVPVLHRLALHTHTYWDNDLLDTLSVPLYVGLAVWGLQLALVQLNYFQPHQELIDRLARIAATIIIFWAVVNVTNRFAKRELLLRSQDPAAVRFQYVGLMRKLIMITAVAITALMIVDQAGFRITPLLTGLGIGGLAVALGLQDTLSNLFAGFYMMLDRPLKMGDYIQLATGQEGFIEEIGWRNTKLRPWANNLIIVPNSVLSQTIITNQYLPVEEMSLFIPMGVGYYSDLEQVERVTIEVGRKLQQSVVGAAPDWEPLVRFNNFGNSNIEFNVILRVKEVNAQYVMKHEFVKAILRRYNQEGIEIAFPMRKVEISKMPERQTLTPRGRGETERRDDTTESTT